MMPDQADLTRFAHDDLHWLCCSPALLAQAAVPAEIAVLDQTLGQQWWLQAGQIKLGLPTAGQPLGRYAEWLAQQLLQQLPQHRLLASQLRVQDGQRSLGEYDFLLLPADGQEMVQLELAVKIYLAWPHQGRLHMIGPGLRDALDLKLQRLFQHQLQLAHHPAGRAALPLPLPVRPMLWLRGWMFYREPPDVFPPMLARDHGRGWWRCLGEDLPQQRPDSVWRSLGKLDWLAPRRAGPDCLPFAVWHTGLSDYFAHTPRALMVAEYAPAEQGGQELARGMLLPAGWPDQAALQRLIGRLV